MSAAVSPQKSTTDRKKRRDPRAPAWMRRGVRALGALSPRLASEAVTPLFFRSQRRLDATPEQAAVFARARPLDVPFGRETVRAHVFGEGPRTALLVHGWNGRAAQMAPFVEPLLDDGWRVVALDHLGHGESSGRGTSLPEMARVLSAVAPRFEPTAAIGHSLGAASLVVALSDGARFGRVALIAPPASPEPWLARFGHALELDARTLAAVRGTIERRAGRALAELDGAALAATLDAPALIVHDRDDREVPIGSGERLHYAWSGSRFLVTAGLGHLRILRHPDVVDSVRRFVGGQVIGGADGGVSGAASGSV